MTLRAPFPWFGGKSRAAHLIWPRFGDVPNYIEPFVGSMAVLLARPDEFPPRVETVNDKDAYLANFWRAVQADPEQVAHYADWPVCEADLHARHRWLVEKARRRLRKVLVNPHYYDAKIAGWWVYGQCLWIGSGWCASDRRRRNEYPAGQHKRPHCDRGSGRGVHQAFHANGTNADNIVDWKPRPDLSSAQGRGGVMLVRKRPMSTGNGQGCGVHRLSLTGRRPNMGGAGGGQGVHAPRLTKQQIPDVSGSRGATGRGIHATGFELRSGGLFEYMFALQARLRRVRMICGDWRRVLTPAVTTYIGLTAVLLDPPYQQDLREICYSHERSDLDFYETPSWMTRSLLHFHPAILGATILECASGRDAITRVLRDEAGCQVFTNDLDPRQPAQTHRDATTELYWREAPLVDWVISNLPFSVAFATLVLARQHAKVGVAFLLRKTFLEPTDDRGPWLARYPPTRAIGQPRHNFRGKGSDTVSCDWDVWEHRPDRSLPPFVIDHAAERRTRVCLVG